MKIVVEYDVSREDVKLDYWNQPDILDSMDREDEPFESVDDFMDHITGSLEDGSMDFDDLFDQSDGISIGSPTFDWRKDQ